MSDVNFVPKRAGTTLSDDIDKYFLCGFIWAHFGNLIVTLCIVLTRCNSNSIYVRSNAVFVFVISLIASY
jgi:hypothetical protein